jgi:hypothetical protein
MPQREVLGLGLGIEGIKQTTRKIGRRGTRAAASMDLEGPSRTLEPPDVRTRFSIRRRRACEVQRICANPSDAQRREHASVTTARRRI